MKNNDDFTTAVVKSLAAGQTNCIIALGSASLRNKFKRDFLRRIQADELLDLCGGSVTTAYGITVPGFAFWVEMQATKINAHVYRHRMFVIFHHDCCRMYAIPASLLEHKFKLPDIELSNGELETYRLIADRISFQQQESIQTVHHPAKSVIKSNRRIWTAELLDRDCLARLLKEHAGWMHALIVAALDTQLRSFKACEEVPIFFYNFTIKKAKIQAESAFIRVMTALNLTGEGKCCNAAPMEITVQNSEDLKNWFGCYDRLVILRTGKGCEITKLFDQSDVYFRQLNYGGILPPKLPTVPVIRSKTVFDRSDVLDCELPEELPVLTEQQLDWLRTSVSLALTGRNATDIVEQWYQRMNDRHSYLRSPFEEWRRSILDVFCSVIFGVNDQSYKVAASSWMTAQERQMESEAERSSIVQKALDLIEDQSRYEDEIIAKPASNAEVERLLNNEQSAVAFRHHLAAGKHKGQHFIVFTDHSLLRLTQRAGMTEELYQAFKNRAKQSGLMTYNSRTVKFKDATCNGFWFSDKKF